MYISSEIYGLGGTIKLGAIANLLLRGSGPLASTGCDHGAFVNTRGGRGEPDLQIRFVPGCGAARGRGRAGVCRGAPALLVARGTAAPPPASPLSPPLPHASRPCATPSPARSYALDPDAIQSYVKYGQLRKEGKTWPGGITMQLLTARPQSRGRVSVYSSDPFAHPKARRAARRAACGVRALALRPHRLDPSSELKPPAIHDSHTHTHHTHTGGPELL